MKFRRKSLVALSSLALAVPAAGIATAAIPDSGDGTYYACRENFDYYGMHQVFLIDKASTPNCPAGYTQESWPSEAGSGADTAYIRVQDDGAGTSVYSPDEGGYWQFYPVANCPTGHVAVGGGFEDTGTLTKGRGPEGPTADGKGWEGYYSNQTDTADETLTVICAPGTTSLQP